MGISVLTPSNIAATQNLLHNGAMQVHQRGTSIASITAGGTYTVDRYYAALSALGTWTQSVENDAPTGSGFRKSLKMLCTTADAAPAAGDYFLVQQSVEGQNLQAIRKGTADAQPITLSFWTKSNATGTYVVSLLDQDNTRRVSASYTVSVSATWERKTITFPADTTGAWDNDNASSLTLQFWLASGTTYTSGALATTWGASVDANTAVGQTNLGAAISNYWQVTGIQLEAGATATKFQFKDYGQELQECQRYYQVIPVGTYAASGTCYDSSASILYTLPLAVEMRTAPTPSTITTSGLKTTNSSGVSTNTNAIITTYTTPTQVTPIATVTGSSYGNARVGYIATAITLSADI
jgi:hypothetical protein